MVTLVAKMDNHMKVVGKKEKNMDMENTLGLMIVHMKGNILKTKGMEWVKCSIVMDNFIMENGNMGRKMEKANFDQPNKTSLDIGKMAI